MPPWAPSGKAVLSQDGRRQVYHIWPHVPPSVVSDGRSLKMVLFLRAISRPDLAALTRRDLMNGSPTQGEHIQHPERCPGRPP